MKKTTLLVILMTLACSTEPGDKILPDVQLDASGAEASTHDGAVELGTVEEDVAVAPEEVNTDTGFEISPECEPGAGCFLDPCENSGDCLYGPCVQHLGNKVCSQGCVEECPDGWLCEQIADTGPDLQFACVSSYTHLCLPCTNSDDCESASGVQDVCVAYGNKGSFCGADCVEGGCPMGYSCVNALTVEGAGMMQCVADAGICSCSEQAEKLGLSTPCAEENEFGLCPGQRICGPEGLSICDALVPGPEECNGADDDCDGNVDNDVCIDESECTKDSCDPEVGCVFQPLTGTTCDDADVCSLADHCEDGQCMGTVINCDDDNPCTTDSCDPAGGCVYSFNSSTCDDDDPCTVGDACVMGSCTGTQVPCDCQDDGDCLELEDGDVCNGTLYCDMNSFLQVCKVDPQTVIVCDQPQGPGAECFEAVCQAKTGECEIEPDNDGFFCEDNNPCTVSSLCEAGECVGGVAMNCGDDNDCTEDSCEPTTGCVHTPNDNLCEDGNLCTIGDSCVEGKCLAGQQLTCNDGNSCTDDSCQPAAGCVHMMNTAPCNDGNACTTGDTCLDGACTGTGVLPCNDGNPCTDDSCDSVAGCGFVNNSAACTDGNPCTANDQCKDGACQGQGALDCDDGSACTDDACSPVTGCTHVNNVAPCSDGNVCTMDDACDAGVCQGQGQLDCEDNNACTDDWCEPLKGCLHTDNGAACNDSNECTVGDKCQGGKCKFDDVVDCDDGNPCTKDSCQSGAGCVYVDASGACDDGNPCTTNDYCENGGCISGAGQTCDDGNPCTDDSCDDTGQCQHAANDFDCDDGNECTDGDICTAGSCVGGELLDCDDENICTTDTCSPAAGCIHTLNNAPCDDDNVCTTKDACNLGKCVGASPLVCDDGNPCTDDSCNGVSGCVFVNNDAPCNDDSLCTDGEECSSGWCVGIPVVCNDNNLCTDDSCAPDQGCTFDHNAAPCDDDNACTINDVCLNGVCSETQLQDCEDNNVCTDDSCDELLGCVNANNIVAFLNHIFPPRIFYAASKLNTIWTVIPKTVNSAVDFRTLKDKTATLTK